MSFYCAIHGHNETDYCDVCCKTTARLSDVHKPGNCKAEGQTTFDSGAKRSAVMPYYAAIPYLSLRRLALRATGAPSGETLTDPETGHTYEGGSRKYGYGNWAKGLPLEDTFNHVIEHLEKWKAKVRTGEASLKGTDDDLAAAAWGVMLPLMTFEAEYTEQAKARNEWQKKWPKASAEETDAYMRRTHPTYLLQPLAPETPPVQQSQPVQQVCGTTARLVGFGYKRCGLDAGHSGPHVDRDVSWVR